MNIAFYCASSEQLDKSFYNIAIKFVDKISENNWNIISGGSNVGLMKTLAQTAKLNSLKTIGVITKDFDERNLTCFDNFQIIITKNLQERKKKIIELADAFIVLPGGFGTLDEFFETITLKLLGYFDKPIVLFNQNNFYDYLIKQIELIFEQKFATYASKKSFFVSSDIDETIEYIKKYKIKAI